MQKNLQKIYPNAKFLVLIYPGSKYAKELTAELDQLDVPYLDYSPMFDRNSKPYIVSEVDQHPSPYAYQKVAERLIADLQLK